jgi:phenylacetate-CoA ligase
VRVNLHPTAWRSQEDCEKYLNQWRSPIWLGDPIAFAGLEGIDLVEPPQAIVSSIMRLSAGSADQLTSRYGCPVLDLYALTEAGILALGTEWGHEVLPHDVYVEILEENDEPCPAGTRGEITVTSGRNPYVPLLRYRTGDFAAIEHRDGKTFLAGLEGRIPVEFPLPSGRVVHSMEVTRLMRQHPLLQYRLHQDADGGFSFSYRGNVDERALTQQLSRLLEAPTQFTVRQLTGASVGKKIPEFQSEVVFA